MERLSKLRLRHTETLSEHLDARYPAHLRELLGGERLRIGFGQRRTTLEVLFLLMSCCLSGTYDAADIFSSGMTVTTNRALTNAVRRSFECCSVLRRTVARHGR